jgi:hypothetical protein
LCCCVCCHVELHIVNGVQRTIVYLFFIVFLVVLVLGLRSSRHPVGHVV